MRIYIRDMLIFYPHQKTAAGDEQVWGLELPHMYDRVLNAAPPSGRDANR